MIKSSKGLERKCHEYLVCQKKASELNDRMESLKSEIKEYIGDTEYVEVGNCKISFKTIFSNVFDQSLFKSQHPKVYDRYCSIRESRRFTVRN